MLESKSYILTGDNLEVVYPEIFSSLQDHMAQLHSNSFVYPAIQNQQVMVELIKTKNEIRLNINPIDNAKNIGKIYNLIDVIAGQYKMEDMQVRNERKNDLEKFLSEAEI